MTRPAAGKPQRLALFYQAIALLDRVQRMLKEARAKHEFAEAIRRAPR